MNRSLRVARVSGINIEVHLTFGLILLLAAMVGAGSAGLAGALFGIVATALLFVCVALHELGHSLVAQRYGIRVERILLMPLGGLAMLEGRPKHPKEELAIAVAGPAVNVVIAGALALGIGLFGLPVTFDLGFGDPSFGALLGYLLLANIGVALFNMIPAFPLDGGRVLRAVLAWRRGWGDATRIAAKVGQIAAIGLGAVAVMTMNLILGLIALFIFFGAKREHEAEIAHQLLSTVSAARAARSGGVIAEPHTPVGTLVRAHWMTGQTVFPVFDHGLFAGGVTKDRLGAALAHGGYHLRASDLAVSIPIVSGQTHLADVLDAMQRRKAEAAAVFEGGIYLGLLTHEDIARTAQLLSGWSRNGRGAPIMRAHSA